MNKDKILAEIAELFEPKWGYNTKEQWLKLVADILTAHEQEGMNHTTADKILTDMFESGWFHQDQIDYFEKEIINSLVSEPETDNEIAKRVIEEYIENGLKEKYRKGAGHGWEKGISYKHEVSLLQDCYEWLDKKPYDPHEVAQMKDKDEKGNLA